MTVNYHRQRESVKSSDHKSELKVPGRERDTIQLQAWFYHDYFVPAPAALLLLSP